MTSFLGDLHLGEEKPHSALQSSKQSLQKSEQVVKNFITRLQFWGLGKDPELLGDCLLGIQKWCITQNGVFLSHHTGSACKPHLSVEDLFVGCLADVWSEISPLVMSYKLKLFGLSLVEVSVFALCKVSYVCRCNLEETIFNL